MKSTLEKLEESPSIAKFEIVEDELGKRTTISMNPRYFFFKNNKRYVEFDGQGRLEHLDSKDFTYLIFDVRDKSNNAEIPISNFVKIDGHQHREMTPKPVLKASTTEKKDCYFSAKYEGGICPVMYNSKHNMLELIPDNYTKMNSISFIDYMSVMQFKDGTNYININHTEVSYNRRTNRLFYSKDDRYSLKLRGGNGRTSLVKNNRLCMSHKDICDFFGIIANNQLFLMDRKYHKEYGILQDLFCELFFHDYDGCYEDYLSSTVSSVCIKNPVSLTHLYRVKRNKHLEQLPWDEYSLAQIYNNPQTYEVINSSILTEDEKREISNARVNINRYLRKGNTKKATDACFHGYVYPKAFRRLMLKTPPLYFDKKTYRFLHEIVKSKGVNNALSYFSVDGMPDYYLLAQTHALEAIALGFNARKIINRLNDKGDRFDNNRLIIDALKMRQELIDMQVDINIDEKDIFRYHDLITKPYNAVMEAKNSAELVLYRTIDTSEQLPSLSVGEYVIRSPRNAYELLEVGNVMSHCVGSYMKDFFYRSVEICLVEKNGDYHVCLEIIGNTLVQAKMSNNRKLVEDKEALELVKQWAKQNSIEIATTDCGSKTDKHLAMLPPCKERLTLFKEVDMDNIENDKPDLEDHLFLDEFSLSGL